MTTNISGFGLVVRLIASSTFPTGIDLTQFADDADPFDTPSQELAAGAMGLNGDAVQWARANLIPLTINIIPNSDDDRNLAVLAEANRVAKGKNGAQDEITITGVYPDGRTVTYVRGFLSNAMLGNSVSSAGRMKSKPYIFQFEDKANT